MDDENIFENLPSNPEQAFLELERYFRAIRDTIIERLHSEERSSEIEDISYAKKVIAVITELGLVTQFGSDLPDYSSIDRLSALRFISDVEYFVTKLKLRFGRRVQGYSVKFDATVKEKIRFYLSQIRGIVDKLEVDQKKKEAFFSKISALEKEVDRDRTRFEVFGALIIEVAGVAGEAAGKLEPVRKVIDSISGLFWGAKNEEEARQLPSPPERKQIEPPRTGASGDEGSQRGDTPASGSGDKIPF